MRARADSYDWPATKILITGPSGSGKTTLLLASLELFRGWQWCIFDPDREFARRLGLPVCTMPSQISATIGRRLPLLYDPTHFREPSAQAFARFARLVFDFSPYLQQTLLVTDEIESLAPRKSALLDPAIADVVCRGRRRRLDLLVAAQNVGLLHGEIRPHITKFATLRHHDPGALAWLTESGFRREQIVRLDPHEFATIDNRGRTGRGKVPL